MNKEVPVQDTSLQRCKYYVIHTDVQWEETQISGPYTFDQAVTRYQDYKNRGCFAYEILKPLK